jgi:hypothetical protein
VPEIWPETKGENMPENKSTRLPSFVSLDELVEFFDSNDMGEYWDGMPEVDFEVDIKKRGRFFTIDEELEDKLAEIARLRGISCEALINSWLREKVKGERCEKLQ